MKKSVKITLTVIAVVLLILFLILGTAFALLAKKTKDINDDYSQIYTDDKFNTAVKIDGLNVITQDISCGYAVIEMFSDWNGEAVTEENLYDTYGKVVTSTGESFCSEMNKQVPDFHTEMYSYLTNYQLMEKVYDSLSNGVPVPFEWAAPYENQWTLHYSIVIGLDIPKDTVTVANPYGYIETISVKDFLDRTSFNAYENMPFYFQTAFAFDIFEKNTVFIPVKA